MAFDGAEVKGDTNEKQIAQDESKQVAGGAAEEAAAKSAREQGNFSLSKAAGIPPAADAEIATGMEGEETLPDVPASGGAARGAVDSVTISQMDGDGGPGAPGSDDRGTPTATAAPLAADTHQTRDAEACDRATRGAATADPDVSSLVASDAGEEEELAASGGPEVGGLAPAQGAAEQSGDGDEGGGEVEEGVEAGNQTRLLQVEGTRRPPTQAPSLKTLFMDLGRLAKADLAASPDARYPLFDSFNLSTFPRAEGMHVSRAFRWRPVPLVALPGRGFDRACALTLWCRCAECGKSRSTSWGNSLRTFLLPIW